MNDERNGKGKEYHCNHIIKYEGEYIKGKRNGIGKEYYFDGILEFEGEYLDGKKWNGKEYDNRCKLICELKNGNGKIIEYDILNEICFEGEYKDGIKTGKGKEFNYNSNLKFEGEYINGKKTENLNNIL